MTTDSKTYVKSTMCRRKHLMNYFSLSVQSPPEHPHLCCDVCGGSCECDVDHTTILSLPEKWFRENENSNSSSDNDSTCDFSSDLERTFQELDIDE